MCVFFLLCHKHKKKEKRSIRRRKSRTYHKQHIFLPRKIRQISLQSHTQTLMKPGKVFTVPKVLHTKTKQNAYSSLFSYSIGAVYAKIQMRCKSQSPRQHTITLEWQIRNTHQFFIPITTGDEYGEHMNQKTVQITPRTTLLFSSHIISTRTRTGQGDPMERGHLPIHSIASNNSNPELERHSISAAIHAVPEKMCNTSEQPFPQRISHAEMQGKRLWKIKVNEREEKSKVWMRCDNTTIASMLNYNKKVT